MGTHVVAMGPLRAPKKLLFSCAVCWHLKIFENLCFAGILLLVLGWVWVIIWSQYAYLSTHGNAHSGR